MVAAVDEKGPGSLCADNLETGVRGEKITWDECIWPSSDSNKPEVTSPLILAAHLGDVEMLAMLMQLKADVTCAELNTGLNALHVCCKEVTKMKEKVGRNCKMDILCD